MGSTALHGSCDWPVALPLYAGCWCWTMLYDTIYAHQDKADDARAGVLSTALRLGEHSRAWLALFALGCVGSLAVAGLSSSGAAPGVHVPALGAGLACGAAHLAWQLRTVDLHSRADCLRKFQANHHFGALVFAAIVVGKLAQRREEPEEERERAAASKQAEPFPMAC